MHYNEATDGYDNDRFEELSNTGFRCDIPYLIEREKYESVLEKRNFRMRIKDADVVTFSTEYSAIGDTLFVFPQNSPEGSEDSYECFSFYFKDFGTYDQQREEFHNFVSDMEGCIAGPSPSHCVELKRGIADNIKKELEDISIIDEVLYE